MTLPNQLRSKLECLAPFSTGQQVVEAIDGPRTLSCHLVALDSLACAFMKLALADETLSHKSTDELKTIAERLSSRLTYLLEPISPIEIDSQGCVVQLRSSPPHKESDKTCYYELLVSRGGTLSLCRYERAAGQARQSVAAHVTREVLVRLAADFCHAVA